MLCYTCTGMSVRSQKWSPIWNADTSTRRETARVVDGRWLMVTVLLTGEAFSIQHCTTMNVLTTLLILLSTATIAQGFAPIPKTAASFRLSASTEDKVAKEVTGEDLELMLQEWDEPLIIDAYATWWEPTASFGMCVLSHVICGVQINSLFLRLCYRSAEVMTL